MIFSSSPDNRLCPFFTICGSNSPCRSRGTAISATPKWELLEPKSVQVFQRDLALTFTFYEFDPSLHRHIRTSNHLERLFREFRTIAINLMRWAHSLTKLVA
ncbi:hypothetical protein [Pseudanabaena sp. SR411]|uniref:hypothetical protein n=1 Tax=Pseudanabaena sp. SR411 TaxID=1980935 RepID=UPI0015957B38|nr:hypothetical protein [Pseudanabaena sp. SR411]